MTTQATVRFLTNNHHLHNKPAVCIVGRKTASCVINEESGIRIMPVDLDTFERYAKPVLFKGQPYPLDRAAKQLLEFTKRDVAKRSITKGAKDLLTRVLKGNITEAELTQAELENGSPISSPPDARTSLVAEIARELKLEPRVARRKLRSSGMHAPYEDEAKIREVLSS